MADAILKGCIKEVRSYAQSIGHPITQSQAYEIVARARGFQSANVLAAQKSGIPKKETLPTPKAAEPTAVMLAVKNMTHAELLEYEILEVGDTLLKPEHLQNMTRNMALKSSARRRQFEIEAIVPLSNEHEPSPKCFSELLFNHSDVLVDCTIIPVNYPYGKYNRAYLVTGLPYRFDLPTINADEPRLGKAHIFEDLPEALSIPLNTKIGFGYSELDWKIGTLTTFRHEHLIENRGIISDTSGVLQIHVIDNQKQLVLTKAEFKTLKHLAGCYYELTTGVHEGMRIAFYC